MKSSYELSSNDQSAPMTPSQVSIVPTHSDKANSLLTTPFVSHHPTSGINPLVDLAAYLFSIMGKLKQLKSYRHLHKLQQELIEEINTFQDAAKSHGYSSEYVLVSRYALCATLDDVITNTAWGGQGQWNSYSLQMAFNQEPVQQERFFLILEKIIKDPRLYIDLMELMYICLSLGFKGNYRTTEFSHYQLEQVCHTLYKHIRVYQGTFSKVLSPFPIKTKAPTPTAQPKASISFVALGTMSTILAIFIVLGYLFDAISDQTFQKLIHIGKSIAL